MKDQLSLLPCSSMLPEHTQTRSENSGACVAMFVAHAHRSDERYVLHSVDVSEMPKSG